MPGGSVFWARYIEAQQPTAGRLAPARRAPGGAPRGSAGLTRPGLKPVAMAMRKGMGKAWKDPGFRYEDGRSGRQIFGHPRRDDSDGLQVAVPFRSTDFHSLDAERIVGEGNPWGSSATCADSGRLLARAPWVWGARLVRSSRGRACRPAGYRRPARRSASARPTHPGTASVLPWVRRNARVGGRPRSAPVSHPGGQTGSAWQERADIEKSGARHPLRTGRGAGRDSSTRHSGWDWSPSIWYCRRRHNVKSRSPQARQREVAQSCRHG